MFLLFEFRIEKMFVEFIKIRNINTLSLCTYLCSHLVMRVDLMNMKNVMVMIIVTYLFSNNWKTNIPPNRKQYCQ